MNNRARLIAKTRDAKREKSLPIRCKSNISQSTNSPIDHILFLQRTIGNQAVQRLLKFGMIQAKLTIGQPNDKYEQEADRVAERVMRMPKPLLQRQVEPEEEEKETLQPKPLANQTTPLAQVQRREEPEEEEETLQAKPLSDQITLLVQRQVEPEEEEKEEEWIQRKPERDYSVVTDDVKKRLDKAGGTGSPLPDNIREYMGSQFGYDFNEVKVHADGEAANLARSLSAQAFTSGKDIYFGSDKYNPNSTQGRRLVAHELTHVVQQNGRILQPYIMRQKEPEVPKEEPPKTTKDPKKIAATVIKAFSKTETGKKITKKLKEVATTKEGIVFLSMIAAPTIATMFAEKMEVPQGVIGLVPKIAKIELGKDMEIAFQPIYKGKLGEKPKEWGGKVLFTIKRW
jgi:Domain of unknown function (DUF4157)